MVETAVLLAAFASPDYARQTFDAIKKAKPKKFYFYSNKADINNPDELERNNQVRSMAEEVDWDCEFKTFFRDQPIGIYDSIFSAIDWVFEHEDKAIIFEEDCVPSMAFFDFCDQLLPVFENDLRVWAISGNNFIEGYNPNGYDYTFSRFPFMYGWATWKSRWDKVNRDHIPIDEMKKYKLYKQLFITNFASKQREYLAEITCDSKAWDYVFHSTINCNGGMGIVPNVNLVSNIGVKGVHQNKENPLVHNRAVSKEDKYIINNPPPFIVPDYRYDQQFSKFLFKRSLIVKKIIKIIRKLINK